MSDATRYGRSIVWLRRDLRLYDNVAIHEACRRSDEVCLAFVVNPPLLAEKRMGAPLVTVFFDALAHLRETLHELGSDVAILCGDFADELLAFSRRIGANAVFYNEDYELEAIERDRAVTEALQGGGLAVHASLDHVYFGASEVRQTDGTPYRVFTPYKRRWLDRHSAIVRPPVPSERLLRHRPLSRAAIGATHPVPTPEAFGFVRFAGAPLINEKTARESLRRFLGGGAVERYREDRNIPAIAGTSRLSPHLRAGTIGIRACVEAAFARRRQTQPFAASDVDAWIDELIWREFYQMILHEFPHVTERPFRAAAMAIPWSDDVAAFRSWSEGHTGYPIVDAGMRQLNTHGWMHNRLRMITASFLTKHLLIDWRWGERYFEQHLIDADVAQNNGGWQWAASTGNDAVPYFRIFNPITQSRQIDPRGIYIREFVRELAEVPDDFVHEPWTMPTALQADLGVKIGREYPSPMVDHAFARERALAVFKAAFASASSAPPFDELRMTAVEARALSSRDQGESR